MSLKRSKTSWLRTGDEICRRLLDVAASSVGLVALSPLFLAVGLAIKLDSPGPIFFRGARVGKGGKLFHVYKFRTMVVNAPQVGAGITAAGDRRVTRVGRFLRRAKIDELPQLFNVLKGEMGLVGPRPEDPRYVALYSPTRRRVLEVRPGITSPASLQFRHEEELLQGQNWEQLYREQILPAKLDLELAYLDRRWVGRDVSLILKTLWAIFQ